MKTLVVQYIKGCQEYIGGYHGSCAGAHSIYVENYGVLSKPQILTISFHMNHDIISMYS